MLQFNLLKRSFQRSYHSFYHVNPKVLDLSTLENQILNRAYAYVPELGFTKKAIEKASTDMGLKVTTPSAMFNFTSGSKDLSFELVNFHLLKCRQDLLNIKNSGFFQNFKSEDEKLNFLLMKRLSMNLPIKSHLSNALGLMIIPTHFKSSLEELHNLSDDLSYYAGDRSIDFKWYSKRFALSTLFVQAELFMINDKSSGCENTIKFVESKLKEIDTAGNIYNSVEEWTFFNAVSLINVIKSQLARG